MTTETTDKLNIYIGFDPRQVVSYTALATSIIERSSKPVAITPLVIQTLPIERIGLTPFTFSRFLVPWLQNYEGRALFLDADMLFLGDPAELFAEADKDPGKAVYVREDPDGKHFERAAVMLFNCDHPDNRTLTPEYVDDEAQCRTPHLIDWTESKGTLGTEWGHLVGYNAPRDDAKLVHYTQGTPCFPQTWECEHSDAWQRSFAVSCLPFTIPNVQVPEQAWEQLMGNSVHAKTVEDADGNKKVVPKFWSEAA